MMLLPELEESSVPRHRIRHVAIAIAVALALAGCADSSPAFVDEGNAYTAATVTSVFGLADDGEPLGAATSEASKLRSQALVELRGKGGDAQAAADLVTRTFANSGGGVPVYVEQATFEGQEAFIVVEAIGPKGGKLRNLRVWVLDPQGEVLYSGVR